MRTFRAIAYIWSILIGCILITPRGWFCITCGVPLNEPGYIGRVGVVIVALISIAFGVVGLIADVRTRATAVAKAEAGK